MLYILSVYCVSLFLVGIPSISTCCRIGRPSKKAERQWKWAMLEFKKNGRVNANARKWSQKWFKSLPNVYPCLPQPP